MSERNDGGFVGPVVVVQETSYNVGLWLPEGIVPRLCGAKCMYGCLPQKGSAIQRGWNNRAYLSDIIVALCV